VKIKEQPMKINQGVRKAWSRRPAFSPKQKLTAEQLNAGLQDGIDRQRILNRAIHGYGVVIGYGLSVRNGGALDLRKGHLELGDGFALDRHGRMLVWKGGWLGMDDIVGDPPERAGTYTLVAHYAVRGPLRDGCAPSGRHFPPWTEEGVVFTLSPDRRRDDCGCPEHPWQRCVGHGEYLHRRNGGLPMKERSVAVSPDVEWYSSEPAQALGSCMDGWEYDPDAQVGVPLAQLEVCDLSGEGNSGDCEPRYGFCPDTAAEVEGVRPLVFRNPLLYELTRCCDVDLPRVEEISWQEWITEGWSTPVPWEAFVGQVTNTKTGFEVWFTKPIDARSLHEASIFVTVFYQDGDASWRSYRMPLAELAPLQRDGQTRGARLVPDQNDWVPSEVTGRQSNLFHGVRIEVTIRGQLLRDDFGRMLDARPMGKECGDGCHARPGDDLVTTFQVGPQHRARAESDQPTLQTTTGTITVTDGEPEGA
jgi:hypothetical protein